MVAIIANGEDPVLRFSPPPRDLELYYTISTGGWMNMKHQTKGVISHDSDILDVLGGPLRLGIRSQRAPMNYQAYTNHL